MPQHAGEIQRLDLRLLTGLRANLKGAEGKMDADFWATSLINALSAPFKFGNSKGTTKKLCDKDLAERSGELSGAIGLKTLVLQGNDPVVPSKCSEHSLALFVRFFALRVLFGS